MKLKAMRTFRHGAVNFKRGASLDLSEAKAKDLIARGYVEAATAEKSGEEKKAAPKKAAD